MKIAVPAKTEGFGAIIDDRFGRCEKFVIYNTKTKEVESVDNTAKDESGGAGGKAVRVLSKNGVEAVIVPELGPKASDAMKAFEIKAYKKDGSLTVDEVIKSYEEGKLEEIQFATVEEHSGLRRV
jgi:predicted Fe-Mo cluster-binding NifX family protein